MSSTNKTTNYELSQFLGSDKPAWLSDYNSDMSKIDTQMKSNADTASGADGKADANATAIGTLENLSTTAKTNLVSAVNEVDTNADTAQNTANSASTLAQNNATAIDAIKAYFTMSSITTYDNISNFTNPSGVTLDTPNITIAKNSTNSLGKIYGTIWGNVTSTGNMKKFVLNTNTGITPDEDITIYCAGLAMAEADIAQARPLSIILKTNGTMEFQFDIARTGRIRFLLFPSLYFFSDFNDVITPTS